MKVISLSTQALTKERFAEFGDVIETDNAKHFSINDGGVERYHDLALIDVDAQSGGRAIVSFFKTNLAKSFPHQFNLIERHPKGSQAFIPLFEEPVVLVVAPKGDLVTSKDLRAFITNGKQGFNFHSGVWHMPLISDQKDRCFVVIDRAGPGNNCDEFTFENEIIELTISSFI